MKSTQDGEFEKQVLTAGQCILVFMTILAVFGCSVLVLGFEIGHQTWYKLTKQAEVKELQRRKGKNVSICDNYF